MCSSLCRRETTLRNFIHMLGFPDISRGSREKQNQYDLYLHFVFLFISISSSTSVSITYVPVTINQSRERDFKELAHMIVGACQNW